MSTRPKPPVRRRPSGHVWLKAFIWVFIVVFVLGSVGAIALLAVH